MRSATYSDIKAAGKQQTLMACTPPHWGTALTSSLLSTLSSTHLSNSAVLGRFKASVIIPVLKPGWCHKQQTGGLDICSDESSGKNGYQTSLMHLRHLFYLPIRPIDQCLCCCLSSSSLKPSALWILGSVDHSSIFDIIILQILFGKLSVFGLFCQSATGSFDFLLHQPQRVNNCLANILVFSTSAPQYCIFSPFLYCVSSKSHSDEEICWWHHGRRSYREWVCILPGGW